MDTITTAIVTAVSAELVKDLIIDSYNSFKNVLKKKFGEKSDLLNAVDEFLKIKLFLIYIYKKSLDGCPII